ncbi:MAG: hypothetical protein HS111_24585 [Kofleriaceae bacterium]|nr:hypothetical protein [Kofleriaceae bacterium]
MLGDGDHVWIGADGGAARVRVDGERLAIERTLASAPVRDLVRHDGALYAATWGDGVLRVGARAAARGWRSPAAAARAVGWRRWRSATARCGPAPRPACSCAARASSRWRCCAPAALPRRR